MAQKTFSLDQEAFSCSICLDLLKDPVSIPCGHTYCMNCVKTHWDEEGPKKLFSCPQCRKTFRPRPVLEKNVIIAALVEGMKKVQLQTAPADQSYAGPEDVACDVCTGKKLKAVKSCLVCGASYCENHLQPHYKAPPLKKHKLIHPSKKIQEQICSRHDEVMQILNKEYQSAAEAERAEKQKELEASRQQIQQRIQDKQKDDKLLQQEVEAINGSADKAVEDSEKIFTELSFLIQKRSSEARQRIRDQQATELKRVLDLHKKLEQEITELKNRDVWLEQLSHTEDHNHFLQTLPTLSALGNHTHLPPTVRRRGLFENVVAAVSETRDRIKNILTEKWPNASLTDLNGALQHPELQPRTRADFLKYARHITLEPNTASTNLKLSEGNRKVTFVEDELAYPHHPERFTSHFQVLSRENLTGRCYWEVEWRGGGVSLALAYKNIRRGWTSDEGLFGFNDKSWALYLDTTSSCFWHAHRDTDVSRPRSSRIGVYLDHKAGILSFHSVCCQSQTMTLLHRVQTRFTHPLHAGIWLFYTAGDSAEFIKLK